MKLNEKENVFTLEAMPLEIYLNDHSDFVIKQKDYYGEETFVLIAREQLPAVIKALNTLKKLV